MAIVDSNYFRNDNHYAKESVRWLNQPSPVHGLTNVQFLRDRPDQRLLWEIPVDWQGGNPCQSHGYNRPNLVTLEEQSTSFVLLCKEFFRFTHHRPPNVGFLVPRNLQYEMDVPYIVRGMATALNVKDRSIYRMVYEGHVTRVGDFHIMRLGEETFSQIQDNIAQEHCHLLDCK